MDIDCQSGHIFKKLVDIDLTHPYLRTQTDQNDWLRNSLLFIVTYFKRSSQNNTHTDRDHNRHRVKSIWRRSWWCETLSFLLSEYTLLQNKTEQWLVPVTNLVATVFRYFVRRLPGANAVSGLWVQLITSTRKNTKGQDLWSHKLLAMVLESSRHLTKKKSMVPKVVIDGPNTYPIDQGFIDWSICLGQYQRFMPIHLREDTVDINSEGRSNYGKFDGWSSIVCDGWSSIVDRRLNIETILWLVLLTIPVQK